MSYLASVAMIATMVALSVLICDTCLQFLMFMKIDYKTLGDIEDVEITYQHNATVGVVNWNMGFYPYFFDCFCKI